MRSHPFTYLLRNFMTFSLISMYNIGSLASLVSLMKSAVHTTGMNQFLVRSLLGNTIGIDDDNSVCALNGGQSVSDYQRCSADGQLSQGLLDLRFRLCVECRRGLVQDQDWRVLEEHSRDGQALLLTARQLNPTFPDHRFHTVRQASYQFIQRSTPCGFPDLLVRCM